MPCRWGYYLFPFSDRKRIKRFISRTARRFFCARSSNFLYSRKKFGYFVRVGTVFSVGDAKVTAGASRLPPGGGIMVSSGAGGILGALAGLADPAPSSTLAFVATLHVALAVLRKERSFTRRRFALPLAPAFAFAASPWLLQSPIGLAVGIVSHLAWFAACENLLPVAAPEERRRANCARAEALPAAATLFLGKSAIAPPPGFVSARVFAVVEETPDIRTFRFARPVGFEFRAGQFLSVRVAVEGNSAVRCYTISSAPEASGYLEISVKRQGAVSTALHSTVGAGSTLLVRGPAGKFTYPDGEDRPIVLLAGGVGITPLMSMLRHAVQADPGRPVTLLYSVRTEADVAFRDELAHLARRQPQLRVVVAVTRGSDVPGFFPGRIDASLLAEVVHDPASALHFVCGPHPMIRDICRLLGALGVPETQVRSEAFEAAAAWASSTAGPRQEVAPRFPGATRRLELSRSGKIAPVPPGQTLLDAAEGAGAAIDFSCRSGSCGTCRTRLLSGKVDGEGEGLPAVDRAQGWILPCVALPLSDCRLDA
jgi:ferredoxin-NADP reductase